MKFKLSTLLLMSLFYLNSNGQANHSQQILKWYVDSIKTGDKDLNTEKWLWNNPKSMKGTNAVIEWILIQGKNSTVKYKNGKETISWSLGQTTNATQDEEDGHKTLSWLTEDSKGDGCQFQIEMYGTGKSADTKIRFIIGYSSSIVVYTSSSPIKK